MNRRITLSASLIALATAAIAIPVVTAQTKPTITHTLSTVGGGTLVPNRYIKDTMRFKAGYITVHSGQMLKLVALDGETDPHTFTLARAADLPRRYNDMFSGCRICHQAQADHGAGGEGPPKHPLVTKYGAPGKFDAPGDSVVFTRGMRATVRIDARPGTTLHFLGIIHPWMQGTIQVVR